MGSWDQYIDNLKAQCDRGQFLVEDAAICGFKPGEESVWACSSGLKNISMSEIRKLVNERKDMPIHGTYISGKKCMLIRDRLDEEKLYTMELRTAATDCSSPVNVCVGKTNSALIIVVGKKDVGAGQLTPKVYDVVQYLRGLST